MGNHDFKTYSKETTVLIFNNLRVAMPTSICTLQGHCAELIKMSRARGIKCMPLMKMCALPLGRKSLRALVASACHFIFRIPCLEKRMPKDWSLSARRINPIEGRHFPHLRLNAMFPVTPRPGSIAPRKICSLLHHIHSPDALDIKAPTAKP